MIIKNSGCIFDNEDIEEIASDVFLAIWKNKEKLDINKEIAPYIAGTTKKLILKRKNNIKNNNENIEEYENFLYEKNNDIHIKIEENEKINILTNELTKMKEEDKNIFTYYFIFFHNHTPFFLIHFSIFCVFLIVLILL